MESKGKDSAFIAKVFDKYQTLSENEIHEFKTLMALAEKEGELKDKKDF